MRAKGLLYLSQLSLFIGLSLLGIVFLYYVVVFSASIGIIFTDYAYVKELVGFNIPIMYENLFFIVFTLGSMGAILTYIGAHIIPRLSKEL